MKYQLIDTVFSFTIESIITGKETIHTMRCGKTSSSPGKEYRRISFTELSAGCCDASGVSVV